MTLNNIDLGHVTLQVSDLERSIQYYELILGLTLIRRTDGVADLGTVDGTTVLVSLREKKGVRPVSHPPLLGLYHFAILVPDRAALGRFVAHLADLHIKVGAADHLVSEALYLHDSDGLGIEVYADRPRETWETVDGQLRMTSDPLDFKGLIKAGGEVPWAGMPAGTRMGHVHLHVGDLDRASRFYSGALGLERRVWSYPGALFLAADGYHHHLGLNTWAGPSARVASGDDAKLLEWRMALDSPAAVSAVAARIADDGYSVSRVGDDQLIEDPWGTRLRLTTQHATD